MPRPTVLAVLDDLFFGVKIQDAAKAHGLGVVFVKSVERLLERAKENPVVIFFDLTAVSFDAVELIRQIKGSPETSHAVIIAFLPHVQVDLKASAIEAGADAVLPRSAFSQNLPDLLRRYAGQGT